MLVLGLHGRSQLWKKNEGIARSKPRPLVDEKEALATLPSRGRLLGTSHPSRATPPRLLPPRRRGNSHDTAPPVPRQSLWDPVMGPTHKSKGQGSSPDREIGSVTSGSSLAWPLIESPILVLIFQGCDRPPLLSSPGCEPGLLYGYGRSAYSGITAYSSYRGATSTE